MSVDDVMEPEDDAPGRDRREHDGAVFDRPDDDDLAERTEQERIHRVADYDPDSVPPATDAPTAAITDSPEYQEAEADRQVTPVNSAGERSGRTSRRRTTTAPDPHRQPVSGRCA